MDTRHGTVTWIKAGLAGIALAAGLVSCGGGDKGHGGDIIIPPPPASRFVSANLVSDVTLPGARIDEFIDNAWGLAFQPTGYAWVANNGSSTATSYDGNGVIQDLVVAIPPGAAGDASPTGMVYNRTQDFKVTQNGRTGASEFILVGEAGTVAGWAPAVNATSAVTVFDGGINGPRYKGLAIARNVGANLLYAADFRNNVVDVFNANFVRVSLPGSFRDPGLPAGYAPYGIQAIGDRIYVAYARQAAAGPDEVTGPGLGVVSVFTTGGAFIRQLAMGGALNAPWGMAIAPVNFGTFSNALLVANFGDGKINAFNPSTGSFRGTLGRADGSPIVIDGLWGIGFGNGSYSQPLNTLFFTAGPSDQTHGLYGRIDLQ